MRTATTPGDSTGGAQRGPGGVRGPRGSRGTLTEGGPATQAGGAELGTPRRHPQQPQPQLQVSPQGLGQWSPPRESSHRPHPRGPPLQRRRQPAETAGMGVRAQGGGAQEEGGGTRAQGGHGGMGG